MPFNERRRTLVRRWCLPSTDTTKTKTVPVRRTEATADDFN